MAGGRPPRTTTSDKAAEALVRKAVNQLAFTARPRASRGHSNPSTTSAHLLLATAAARIAAAADRIARAHVTLARQTEGVTWEQVGEAFGTTRQSAHERFGAG
jgi:hypothetical protein